MLSRKPALFDETVVQQLEIVGVDYGTGGTSFRDYLARYEREAQPLFRGLRNDETGTFMVCGNRVGARDRKQAVAMVKYVVTHSLFPPKSNSMLVRFPLVLDPDAGNRTAWSVAIAP